MARIFLCHANEDKPQVEALYNRLRDLGFEPWMDKKDLIPGQNWEREVPLALKSSALVLVCLSQNIGRPGYVQREFKLAMDALQEIPEGIIHTIPVRLEACNVPEQFAALHWCNLFESDGFDELERAIRYGLEQRGLPVPDGPTLPPEDRSAIIRRHITDQIEVLRESHSGVFLYGDLTDQVLETFLTGEIVRVIEQMRLEGLIAFHGSFDPRFSIIGFPPQESPSAMHTPEGPHTISASQTPVVPGSTFVPSFTNSIGMDFILIPAGKFTMGSPDSDPNAVGNEKPAHQVTISTPFYLGKYPVTQAQWHAVMGSNPSHFEGEDRPVEQVSWDDAQSFMDKLNGQEGLSHYRLPTEAQWEYAYRAGSSTIYHFGDDEARLGEYAWYDENSGEQTHSVGQKKPNDWGLYDMHGNILEWTQDWYGSYTADAVTDPRGPDTGADRVLRGGFWGDPARLVRAAFRHAFVPGDRLRGIGFRCLSSGVSQ